jgi:hypothetical protein
VLNAIGAFGAWRLTRFTTCSKSGRSGSGLRIPPPMTTTSQSRSDNVATIVGSADPSSSQGHRRVDGVFTEAGQFLVQGRSKSVSVQAGHCTRIDSEDENARHVLKTGGRPSGLPELALRGGELVDHVSHVAGSWCG